jgi:uncharacterized Zn finger protein
MFISPKYLNFVLGELFKVSKGFLIIETFKHKERALVRSGADKRYPIKLMREQVLLSILNYKLLTSG